MPWWWLSLCIIVSAFTDDVFQSEGDPRQTIDLAINLMPAVYPLIEAYGTFVK